MNHTIHKRVKRGRAHKPLCNRPNGVNLSWRWAKVTCLHCRKIKAKENPVNNPRKDLTACAD